MTTSQKLFGPSEPLPGTENVTVTVNKGTTSYYCRKHDKNFVPIMVGVAGEEPVAACEDCLYEELDAKSADLYNPGRRVVVEIMCSDEGCQHVAEEECVKCHKAVCALHFWFEAKCCIECLELSASGYESEDVDEEPEMPE